MDMSKQGPIILIEDDIDDQEITSDLIRGIGMKNEVLIFSSSEEALSWLKSHLNIQPFIILSDVNLPKMSGIQLKERIDEDQVLKQKSIPFVFYSTSADKKTVSDAYQFRVQGYFPKEASIAEMKENLRLIFSYWMKCKHPNN
jgi:CheY-like chemotaxis protein